MARRIAVLSVTLAALVALPSAAHAVEFGSVVRGTGRVVGGTFKRALVHTVANLGVFGSKVLIHPEAVPNAARFAEHKAAFLAKTHELAMHTATNPPSILAAYVAGFGTVYAANLVRKASSALKSATGSKAKTMIKGALWTGGLLALTTGVGVLWNSFGDGGSGYDVANRVVENSGVVTSHGKQMLSQMGSFLGAHKPQAIAFGFGALTELFASKRWLFKQN